MLLKAALLPFGGGRAQAARGRLIVKPSICLIPDGPVLQRLDALIADYARRTGRAPFGAHLTLASGEHEASGDALRALAGLHGPITLARNGLLRSDLFTRAYALRFTPTPALERLRSDCATLIGKESTLPFEPHVSLTYGAPPPDLAVLDAIAAAFEAPILFDALQVIEAPAMLTEQAHVLVWRYGPILRLTGP